LSSKHDEERVSNDRRRKHERDEHERIHDRSQGAARTGEKEAERRPDGHYERKRRKDDLQ
jgi:hypothetical protein